MIQMITKHLTTSRNLFSEHDIRESLAYKTCPNSWKDALIITLNYLSELEPQNKRPPIYDEDYAHNMQEGCRRFRLLKEKGIYNGARYPKFK